METDNSKQLYELIGRLFVEGRDMQNLIRQLQQSLAIAQEDYDKHKSELEFLGRENNRFKTEIDKLKAQLRTFVQMAPIPDGQEQA